MRWNLAVAMLAASWGLIAVIVRDVELAAEVLVVERLLIAAVALVVGLALARRVELLRLRVLRGRVLLIGALLGVHWYLFFETIKLSSVATAVLTVYTAPILIALVGPLVLPESRSAVALAALVPAAAGLALVAFAGDRGAHVRPLALVTGVAAAATYAALVIATKQVTARLAPPTILFWSYLVAFVVVLPLVVRAPRVVPEGMELAYVGLLGVVFTAASGITYVWLLRHVTAQAVGILAYIEPVSAALLAWAILGEPIGWQLVVGGALIVAAGVAVVLFEPPDPAVAH